MDEDQKQKPQNSIVNEHIKEFERRIKEIKRERKLELRRKNNIPQSKSEEDLYTTKNDNDKKPVFLSTADINNIKEYWICLSEEADFDSDKRGNDFITPCKCIGSTKYVHRRCFTDFVISKEAGDLYCSFCKMKYRLKGNSSNYIICYRALRTVCLYACNVVFIATFFAVFYSIVFMYGLTLLYTFFGDETLSDFVYTRENGRASVRVINLLRICVGAPLIPITMLMSTHKKFNFMFHVVPSFVLIDKLDIYTIIIYALPSLMLIYNRCIEHVENKLGKTRGGASGLIVNDHQFEIKTIVNCLLSPFFGVCIGNALLSGTDFKRCTKSIAGCFLYHVTKDFMSILYLVCLKRRANSVVICEYEE